MQKLFRCIDLRSKTVLFSDMDILDPSFPEYLKMMQIGGYENYLLQQSTGTQCCLTGENIYEGDIVKHAEAQYLVVWNPPAFSLELEFGEGIDLIDVEEVEKMQVQGIEPQS